MTKKKINKDDSYIGCVDMARHMVLCILNNNGAQTPDGLYAHMLIASEKDNKELLKHLKAITSIMNDAIKEIKAKGDNNE